MCVCVCGEREGPPLHSHEPCANALLLPFFSLPTHPHPTPHTPHTHTHHRTPPGRSYRITAFALPRNPNKLYCLTAEACKVLDYRDSYLFHTRNKHLPRLYATPEDREYLASRHLLPSNFKNRTLGLVTARSLFRHFGHLIIQNGRRWWDDYWVGESLEPEDDGDIPSHMGGGGASLSKTRRPTDQDYEPAPNLDSRFYYPEFNVYDMASTRAGDFWMTRAVASAARFNRNVKERRAPSYLDYHTRVPQVRTASQPTTLRIQRNEDPRHAGTRTALRRGGLHLVPDVLVPGTRGSEAACAEEGWVTVTPPDVAMSVGEEQEVGEEGEGEGESQVSRYPLSLVPGQFAEVGALLMPPAMERAEREAQERARKAHQLAMEFGYYTDAPFEELRRLPSRQTGVGGGGCCCCCWLLVCAGWHGPGSPSPRMHTHTRAHAHTRTPHSRGASPTTGPRPRPSRQPIRPPTCAGS